MYCCWMFVMPSNNVGHHEHLAYTLRGPARAVSIRLGGATIVRTPLRPPHRRTERDRAPSEAEVHTRAAPRVWAPSPSAPSKNT